MTRARVCLRMLVVMAIWSLARVAVAADQSGIPDRIDLLVGETRVIEVRPARLAVGKGGIVSVSMAARSQLLLIGEAPGMTVLQIWLSEQESRRVQVTVSSVDLLGTLQAVRELLDGASGLQARIAGQRIVLEGEAVDARARDRAVAITELFPGVVLNFLDRQGAAVTVAMEVRIVEFRRSRLRDLGIRWNSEAAGPGAGVIADFVSNDLFRVPAAADAPQPQRPLAAGQRVWPPKVALSLVTTLDSRLRLLEQRGEAQILAEPTLSCRSGGSARFVAGGEIPLPVVNALGSTDVQFKEYGVILEVQPVADASGAIVARVETEISQIDDSQRVLGIPGLLKRRSVTDVSLRDGETLVIAGLSSYSRGSEVSGLPGLSQARGIGRAFGSRLKRSERTELVIFLTPRILVPQPPGGESAAALELLENGQRQRRELLDQWEDGSRE